MADDKGGGGAGGGWTAVEVVIVIILAIALVSRINGKPIKPILGDLGKEKPAPASVVEKCTISITRPKPLEVIGDFVVLSGSMSACTIAQGGMGVVIVDATGRPISNRTTIEHTYLDTKNVREFEATVPLTIHPTPGTTGYTIVSASNFVEGVGTVRVPIRFK